MTDRSGRWVASMRFIRVSQAASRFAAKCAARGDSFLSLLFKVGGDEDGERAGTRTQDLLIKSQLLYRLSYALVTRGMILNGKPLRFMRLRRCVGALGSPVNRRAPPHC